MKAMLLCAGRGVRMRHLTVDKPKPLLEVQGQSLLLRHLYALQRAGIEAVVINLGYLGYQIPLYIDQARVKDPTLTIPIHYSVEDPVLETGGGVLKALPRLGSDPFIVISADIFTDFDFRLLPKKPEGLLHLLMVDNPPHHPEGDYALIEGRLDRSGSPKFNFAGIGVYDPALFVDCKPGVFPLHLLFEQAIAQGKASGQHYAGLWHNMGTPEQFNDLG
ncbi:MAG: nucleotidyltransferase family protein [Gammaproteobacteria bacterium]|nr:nucleotidyltransferase family protein [Gammaproteobacteria bacterium]MBP9729728.1 nucleotidyltransferase family protein [Gammaproteobacteria bacterium]